MAEYSTTSRSYSIAFDESIQTSFGLPEGVARTAELDALAVALIDAYQSLAHACNSFPHSTLAYSEFSTTTSTALIAERGQVE